MHDAQWLDLRDCLYHLVTWDTLHSQTYRGQIIFKVCAVRKILELLYYEYYKFYDQATLLQLYISLYINI